MTGEIPERVARTIADLRATSPNLDTFDIAEQASRRLAEPVTEAQVCYVLNHLGMNISKGPVVRRAGAA